MKNRQIVMVAGPIHPVPPRHAAAVEWWIYQVSRRLRDFTPHVISTDPGEVTPGETNGLLTFHYIRIGRIYRRIFQKITRLDPWSYAHRAARIINDLNPVIVHVHNTPALAAALAGLTKNRNSQIILHMQNEMSVDGLDGKVALAVPSRYLANWYSQRLPRCDVHIITNGVDTDIYRPVWSPPDPSLLRAQLNLATDKKIIMFAGRICREKGVLELIQAFHHLHKLRNDVNLLIIGEVRSQGRKGDRRAEYGRQVLELCQPLANSCHLLGNVDPAAIHNYYRLADLLVVPSLFEEPFGMVAIEAMAAGVPVLAARRGGLPEFIKHEINGFLTDDAARPDVLASQIHGLLGQPERLGMIRIAARQYVEQHHTWGHVAKQMETIYERMLTC